MPFMPLDRLVIYQCALPLAQTNEYVARHLNTFIALAAFKDGSYRIGDSTLSAGSVTIDLMTREYGLLERHGVLKAFLDRNHGQPQVTAPILTCLDPTLARPFDCRVPLCPELEWHRPADIAKNVMSLAAAGHKVAKVRITPDLEIARVVVKETQRAGQMAGLRFRYDARGALDPAAAETVVHWLDAATTEYLEQPFPAEAWLAMADLYATSPIPLLVSEPMGDGSHVFLAAGCADYIKLQLTSAGSPGRLLELIRQAREIGLKVILGDGRQGFIGSWLEGQVYGLAGLDQPAEITGFRSFSHHFLTGLFESTAGTLRTRPLVPWPELEHKLKSQALRTFRIPTSTVAGIVA
jgi:hypothetical protein